MAEPIAIEARVSFSKPGHGLALGDHRGRPVTDWPDWVSLDVLVEVQLDDGGRVSPPEPRYGIGWPLDCSRQELEESVRELIFDTPPSLPNEPHGEHRNWSPTFARAASRVPSTRSPPFP
jgi:hypothetical protein